MDNFKMTGDVFEKINQIIEKVSEKNLDVGWFKGISYKEGVTVATVVVSNEFGNPSMNVPDRPFINPTIEKNNKRYGEMFNKLCLKSYENKFPVDGILDFMGGEITANIQDAIKAVNSPQLKPATIKDRERRGLNTTSILQATGTMISTITWKTE